MTDQVLEAFLRAQQQAGLELAAASDILDLAALDGPPASVYVAEFHCRGLVREASGRIGETDHVTVGIRFPRDYLRRAHPAEVLALLEPINLYHANASYPWLCIGRLKPGSGLVDILYQVHALITYRKVTLREDDALNKEACRWGREHQSLFPTDPRPLKTRHAAPAEPLAREDA